MSSGVPFGDKSRIWSYGWVRISMEERNRFRALSDLGCAKQATASLKDEALGERIGYIYRQLAYWVCFRLFALTC